MPAARGSAVFHSMGNRWQGRAEMATWKKRREKRRLTHWESHWDPAEQHTESQWLCVGVCVCGGELCLFVYLSKLFAGSGVHDEAKFVWTPHQHTDPKLSGLSEQPIRGCYVFPALITIWWTELTWPQMTDTLSWFQGHKKAGSISIQVHQQEYHLKKRVVSWKQLKLELAWNWK